MSKPANPETCLHEVTVAIDTIGGKSCLQCETSLEQKDNVLKVSVGENTNTSEALN